MSTETSSQSYRLMRFAAIATGVVIFLFAFRPFGLTVDSAADVLMLAAFEWHLLVGSRALFAKPDPVQHCFRIRVAN